jgi:hypothetical protein
MRGSGIDRRRPGRPRPSLRDSVKVVIERRRCEWRIRSQVDRFRVLIFVREEMRLPGTCENFRKGNNPSHGALQGREYQCAYLQALFQIWPDFTIRRVIFSRVGELAWGLQSRRWKCSWSRCVVLLIGVKPIQVTR